MPVPPDRLRSFKPRRRDRHRRGLSIAALAATGLSLLVGCTPEAGAEITHGGRSVAVMEIPWIPAPCVTGEFTGVQTDTALNTVLFGRVEICGTYKQRSAFTLVAFKPDFDIAFAYEHALVPHQPSGPQEVQGVIRSAPSSGTLGVCAMRGARYRIACVRLTFHLSEQTTMEPISIDDQLVNKPVTLVLDGPMPADGACGSCVDLPI